MKDTLIEDLKALTTDGNNAFLPKEPLKDYAGLKTALTKANGKYSRNSFSFPYPAKAIIGMLISGKVIDFKKEFQFFHTDKTVAEQMINEILGYPERILEPSAGHGHLIDLLIERFPDSKIDAVELSELNFSILKEKYKDNPNINLIQGDYLEFIPDKKYDLIFANPPFSKNQDIEHVLKMYSEMEESRGQLISIMSSSWTFGSQKKQVEFRTFAEENFTIRTNDNGAFKSSGTMVQSVMITG
tara:strand:+ start:594 stop:1322 length:729 start_codon:yes stop_codon:yes gene_type:complete